MIIQENKSESLWIALIILFWIAVTSILFVRCGTNPNFWFDESGQFWMSKGLNHFSQPLMPEGNITDVINANNIHNLDPGGYTLGLRFWMILGDSPTWLRGFSFIFFIITMLACAGTVYIWTKNRFFSLAAGLLPLSAPIIAYYSYELRPYSMEVCGVALSFFLLERVSRRPDVKQYFGLGVVCAFFLTSRYSFISTVIATGICILWIIRDLQWRSKITLFSAFCLPVLISCLGIYLITLSHQNPGATPPDYVQSFILHGKTLSQILRISANVLLMPYGIGSTLFIGTYLFFYCRRSRTSKYYLFTIYFIFVIAVNVVFILLSATGKYPWSTQTRWGISLNLLAFFSWLPTILMIANAIQLPEIIVTRLICIVLILASTITLVSLTLTAKSTKHNSLYDNIMELSWLNVYMIILF